MNHAIILAAGQGKRLQSSQDKMLISAGGHPLIYYSLMVFNDHPDIDSITIVCHENNKSKIEEIAKLYRFSKFKQAIIGGLTRQQSLEKGLESLEKTAKKDDIILVHNGANPLPGSEEISQTIEIAGTQGACIVGHFISATVKEVNDKHVIKTHDRDKLFAAETPQAVKYNLLKKALENAKKQQLETTDEAMLLEATGHSVAYVEASEENFKITTQSDYTKLKAILGDLPEDFRVGLGQDSHIFEDEIKGLTLGGIEIPDEFKLKANSDGDVILHAIFNAISQAIGDMSIGFYADEICESGEQNSQKYLDILLKKLTKQKLKINSVGLMLECKKPKIDPLVSKLKKSLSQILGLSSPRIGITATSGEELTLFGAGIGIQCFAIVSLIKI